MKKRAIVLFLALFLLSGCATVGTTGQPEQPAYPLMHVSPSPAVSGAVAEAPDMDTAAVPPVPAADALAVSQAIDKPPTAPSYEPSSSSDMLKEALDGVFQNNSEFSGNVLIEKAGKVIINKCYGMANSEKGIKNTTDTKFLIASVTKQFTAMAVMQLCEKGLLDIKGKLTDYIPEFIQGDEITISNLLTQTSGIMDYMNGNPALLSQLPYDKLSEKRIIELVGAQPLQFEPGTKYAYSNTNYLILGYIVEKISGLSYGDYLEKNIFEQLGMNNTGVFDIAKPPENMATGYTHVGKPVCYYTAEGDINAETARSVMGSFGAGCLYSTVGDLYLWDQALSTEKLVSKSSINMMMSPSVPVPGANPECAYGFGWVIENDPIVGTVVRHTGILSGFRAYNGFFNDQGVTVIILYNIKEFTDRDKLIPSLKQVFKTA